MGQYELIFEVDPIQDRTVHEIYGTYDAIYSEHGATCLLTVTADGPSLTMAAASLVRSLEAGHGVRFRRAYEDLVTRADIASRVDATVQAVGQWIRGDGLRGKEPFPTPFNNVAGGIWLWADVNQWLKRVGKPYDADLIHPFTSGPRPVRGKEAIETELSVLGARRAALRAEMAAVTERLKDVVVNEVQPRLIPPGQRADDTHDFRLKDVAVLAGVGRQAVDAWLGKYSWPNSRSR